VWTNARAGLLEEVERLELDPAPDAAELDRILDELDSLTLWHLLGGASKMLRQAAGERLAQESAPPPDALDVSFAELSERNRADWLERMPWHRSDS
jgi:hypothetical protein